MTESPAELLRPFGARFRFREEYASGEGRTLRVTDRGTGEDLVVKVLEHDVAPAEASLLLSLRHPSIPRVREVGRLPDGRAFVVRSHVDGTPLRVLPPTTNELLDTLRALLEVLAYVHLRGVVHLDLKPSNLLRDHDGALHLLDFGLGVRTGAGGRGGTPFFAAPELLLGGVPDARSDLFSIGAMAAQAVWPGKGPPFAAFVDAFPARDFFAAGGIAAADLPAPFDAFVARCVARRPARRFPDAQAALEFLCGASGRPSPALLAPDPLVAWAAEVQRASGANTADVLLEGAGADDRAALAMHLAATTPGVRGFRTRGDALLVERDGSGPVRIQLPPLDASRLRAHLASCLGLEGDAAEHAAAWLLEHTDASSAAVHERLLDLVRGGEVIPSGSRWTWPAARTGRLDRTPAPPPEATPDAVRVAAAGGRREQAIALWQAAAGDAAAETALRQALAEGLLDGGEPAHALPFCIGLPVLRAQALFDTGQVRAARCELESMPEAEPTPRHRRLRAMLALADGRRDEALALLRRPGATVLERLTLAAACEQAGLLDECERVLTEVGAGLLPQREPFVCASASTVRGHLLRQRGDLDAAERAFRTASDLLFAIGHVRHAATAELNLGVIQKDRGAFDEAIQHLREARTMFLHVGDPGSAARAGASLGITALARGDAATAVQWLTEAAATLQQLGDAAAAQLAEVMLADAHAQFGDTGAAERLLAGLGEPSSARVAAQVRAVRARLDTRDPKAKTPPMPDPRPDERGPSRELFRTFLAVNRQLAQATALEVAMRTLLDAAVTLTGGRVGYLLVAREDGMRREFESGDAGARGQAFSRSLANRAMQLQRTLTGADGLADRDLQDAPSIRNLQVRSAVCAPFRSATGTVGAIYVEHPGRAGAFAEGDKEALEMLADQAAIAVDRMLREEALHQELASTRTELTIARRTGRRGPTRLLGDSDAMRALRAQIGKLAPLELPVLVLGETGTGKELVARSLHEQSNRHRGPFVAENCSALPAELMERELFGHVKGAFTGADRDQPGLFELANGGTLFLDEVGDMPAPLQAKLLRALQERTVRRVGGTEQIPLDLRLVAATHKDLRAMVQRGEFREDLFFRIAGVELRVPPLRERGDDVVLLAEHFVQRHGEERGRSVRLSAVAKAALRDHGWPGNVRELDHLIARATLLCDGDEIVDLQLPRSPAATTDAASTPPRVVSLKDAERQALVAALAHHGGDKTKAAKTLGISRTALYEKIKRHGLG